jgi:peptidoglycan/LPS O-acetylase OafA/YrhL
MPQSEVFALVNGAARVPEFDVRAHVLRTTGNKIASVNGLRGIAICGVVIHHSFFYYALSSGFGRPLLTNGWLGVDLFFLLSGFVLYLPYAGDKPIDVGVFYRRRFWRLAPLFFFVCLISTAFSERPSGLSTIALFTGLFPLHPKTFFPHQNWVLWSLGIEIYFSIAFPFIAKFYKRHPYRSLAAAVVVASIVRTTGYHSGSGQYLDWISASLPGRIDEFLLGMSAARLWLRVPTIPYSRFFIPAGCLFTVLAMFGFDAWIAEALPHTAGSILISIADAGFFLILVGALYLNGGLLSRTLGCWPLQMLGLMCYSIYVWHALIVTHLFPDLKTDVTTTLIWYPLYLAITLGLSAMTYRFIEFRSIDDWRALFLLGPRKQLDEKTPLNFREGNEPPVR